MSPRRRANETSGYDGNKIGTPLKTAVTDNCVDDNTGPYAQSCAYASLLASLCRPSSTPQGSDNFIALPPVSALSCLHWGLIICRPSGSYIRLARGDIMRSMQLMSPRMWAPDGRPGRTSHGVANCPQGQMRRRKPGIRPPNISEPHRMVGWQSSLAEVVGLR